jgi:feruloyl esterase
MGLASIAAAVLGASSASSAVAAGPNCTSLAGLASVTPGVLSITSVITPAAGADAAYCQINLKYLREINIRVGLPLSAADGGTGGLQGAWNGKIRNLGGGGFAGSVGGVTKATNTGYVGSSTDTGHNSTVCANQGHPGCAPGGAGFVLDASNNLIASQITDFIKDSIIEQVRWAKRLAKLYYGMQQVRNYWDGCSTGGRQGMEMAQKYGDQFDGILAGSPAMNWNRFQTGELWPGVVLNDMIGTAGIATTKINAAVAAANAACDGLDGVVDGIVNEPRRCNYSAQALKCTGGPSDAATCLTQTEADVIDKVWDGPRNARGNRLWGGPFRNTPWSTVTGGSGGVLNKPGSLPFSYKAAWVEQDPNYDYTNITIANYPTHFQKDDVKFKSVAETDNPVLDSLKNSGGKLLTFHGGADPLIFSYGSLEYWTRVFNNYGGPANTDSFFRAFFPPGVGHCGGNAVPQLPDMFGVLVNWVENGVAPDSLVLTQTGAQARTRLLCKYPNQSVYNGSGSVDDQANYHCVVNLTEPADLKAYSSSAKRYNEAP